MFARPLLSGYLHNYGPTWRYHSSCTAAPRHQRGDGLSVGENSHLSDSSTQLLRIHVVQCIESSRLLLIRSTAWHIQTGMCFTSLSTLLSGSSRHPSSDGRANHRTHTPIRLEQQQLDRFHYETTDEDNKTPSRFQEWAATLQAAEHITRMDPRCIRMESRRA